MRVRVRLKVLRVRVLRVRVLRVSVRVCWGYSLPSTAMKRMHALPMTARSPKSRTGTTKPIEAAKKILSSQCRTRLTCAVPAM